MNVLVFGHDSSTHAVAWKLINSAAVNEVIVAPGNAGTTFFASSTALAADDHHAVASFVLNESIDLVVADAAGIASGLPDEIGTLSIAVCGSSRAVQQLHTSRCAAREWLQQHNLPTPRSRICTSRAHAEKYAATVATPLTIIADRADGPAFRCADHAAAQRAIAACFDDGSNGVIVEAWVAGPTVTTSLLTDGHVGIPVPPVRLWTADQLGYAAINGAHSAATPLWQRLDAHLQRVIRQPLLAALEQSGSGVRGWIGATCVLGQHGPLIQTLHLVPSPFELAATLPRLQSDLLPLLLGSARGTLGQIEQPRWSDQATVSVGLLQHTGIAIGSDALQHAVGSFQPGMITFQHAPAAVLSNPYVPLAERYGKAKTSLGYRSVSSVAAHTLAVATTDDPLLAIVTATAPDLATARERVYTDLQRSSLPTTLYRAEVGSREV